MAKLRKSNHRDEGGFVALPWAVLDSNNYRQLSHPAKSLLIELARQLGRDNNGRLLTGRGHLSERGWKSADVIRRATLELIKGGFIHQTVQGCRPNKASWFAVTWMPIERLHGYDAGALESFIRSAYRLNEPLPKPKPTREQLYRKWDKPSSHNEPLRPSHGQERPFIGPSHGQGAITLGPSHGPM
jgi:hypothetical protein